MKIVKSSNHSTNVGRLRTNRGFQSKYPFDELLTGDYFDVDASSTTPANIRAIAGYHNRQSRGVKKFSTKTIGEKIRVTRIY